MAEKLLAVDMGLKSGLALYDKVDGLVWYRSHNYGAAARLKRGAHSLIKELNEQGELECIVIEGGGVLADIWKREATRRGIRVMHIGAEKWRKWLLLPRQQRSGAGAKRSAGDLARKVIDQSKAPKPTSLKHDAAEAILIGLWGIHELGWITEQP